MTRSELIKAVAIRAGVNLKQAGNVIEETINTIMAEVMAGNKVIITGFGTFENRTRAPRQVRNPRTGEPMNIDSSNYPYFKAGKTFKAVVNSDEAGVDQRTGSRDPNPYARGKTARA